MRSWSDFPFCLAPSMFALAGVLISGRATPPPVQHRTFHNRRSELDMTDTIPMKHSSSVIHRSL